MTTLNPTRGTDRRQGRALGHRGLGGLRRRFAALGLVAMAGATMAPASAAPTSTITSVAGHRPASTVLPPANPSELHRPNSPVFDSSGNMFVADRGEQTVRKITPGNDAPAANIVNGDSTEINTIVAGHSGIQGFNGDGTDPTTSTVRTVTDGAISINTIDNVVLLTSVTASFDASDKGAGVYGSGIPTDPDRPTTIYAVNSATEVVLSTNLDDPKYAVTPLTVPSGTVTVTIKRGVFQAPTSLAVDSLNNLLIADQFNHRIRYLNLSSSSVTVYSKTIAAGHIDTVAGSGACAAISGCTATEYGSEGATSTSVKLKDPSGVALDGNGDLYIADMWNRTVRKVVRTGTSAGTISTVAGTKLTSGFSGDGGAATSAKLGAPIGVTVSGSRLFVTDKGNNNVRLVNLNASGAASVTANGRTVAAGNIDTVAGCASTSGCNGLNGLIGVNAGFNGDGVPGGARSALLNFPFSTAFDGNNLYISDEENNRVRVVDSAGTILTYAGNGAEPCNTVGQVNTSDACDEPAAAVNGDGGSPLLARINGPRGVTIANSSLYIADTGADRIRRVNPL